MSSVRIEQYAGAGRDERDAVQVPLLPLVAPAVNLDSGGASAAMLTPFNEMTRVLRVTAIGGAVAVTVGEAPVATAADAGLVANESRWFAIDRTQAAKLRLAVIDLA